MMPHPDNHIQTILVLSILFGFLAYQRFSGQESINQSPNSGVSKNQPGKTIRRDKIVPLPEMDFLKKAAGNSPDWPVLHDLFSGKSLVKEPLVPGDSGENIPQIPPIPEVPPPIPDLGPTIISIVDPNALKGGDQGGGVPSVISNQAPVEPMPPMNLLGMTFMAKKPIFAFKSGVHIQFVDGNIKKHDYSIEKYEPKERLVIKWKKTGETKEFSLKEFY